MGWAGGVLGIGPVEWDVGLRSLPCQVLIRYRAPTLFLWV
jgi:hypothetical protein